jgi:glycosyltransferase involved in cell wall biosynthesis
MQNSLVSICCTAYNHAKFISECLDGFLLQKTNFNFEVLIHDDASTDGTQDIIKAYQAKYPNIIKPIFQTENQYSKGVKPFIKYLFPASQGKYIAMCEGDDYWTDPLKLQKQVDFLEANAEFVVCCHNAKIIDENSDVIQEKKIPSLNVDKVYTQDDLKLGGFLLTLSLVFRNLNIFKNFPLPKQKILNGDTYLISLLGKHGKGYYMENIKPAVYRVHSGGIWSLKKNNTIFTTKSRITLYTGLKELHNKDSVLKGYFDKRITDCFNILVRNLKNLSLKEVIWVNKEYSRRHNFFKNKYRFKVLIKENLKYILRL